jgi:virginiamycin A acetyltransferase
MNRHLVMRSTFFGRFVARYYKHLPRRASLLDRAVRSEGGEMLSTSLRLVLHEYYGVSLGDFSYGGLARPGAADRNTVIGRYSSVGANVRRFGAAHPVDRKTMHPFWYNPRLGLVGAESDVPRSSVFIGHDSWIGAGVIILPKVSRIGIGAVVGAGSVVTRDVPDFAIAVGNPARVIGYRFSEIERDELLRDTPWNRDPAGADEYFREHHSG